MDSSAVIIDGITSTSLHIKETGREARFDIPLMMHLRTGDRIEFYHGSVSDAGIISHRDYKRATIVRDEKRLATLDPKDMQLLELAKSYRNH